MPAPPSSPPSPSAEAIRRPRIGITVDNLDNAEASGRYDVGSGYARAVADAGGLPLLLPHELGCAEDYARLCDGLILTGGVDPDTTTLPADWPGHGPLHPKARVMDPRRQRFELDLLAAWDRLRPDSPLLGICLGMQLLTLHHRGTLNQYLPDTHPEEVVERHRKALHPVHVEPAQTLLPVCDASIMSHHQQVIAEPGELIVAARAEDGIIEAVQDPRRPYRLGVQWHPERSLEPGHPLGHGLIARFVSACAAAVQSADDAVDPGAAAGAG